jgi:hypothetical protein
MIYLLVDYCQLINTSALQRNSKATNTVAVPSSSTTPSTLLTTAAFPLDRPPWKARSPPAACRICRTTPRIASALQVSGVL